jgi:hypothetical protein
MMKRHIPLVVLLVAVLAIVVAAFRSGGTNQPEDLAALIDQADKLVVLDTRSEELPVLFESSDRRDLEELKTSLRVNPSEEGKYCTCGYGSPTIVLYANGEKIGEIANHHLRWIRCSLWQNRAVVGDAEAFLKWFDDRDILNARMEYEIRLEETTTWKDNKQRWLEAMPPAIRRRGPPERQGLRRINAVPFREVLARDMPDRNERILALFAWFGSGAGHWSGYPTYESLPQEMLLEYPTADLLAAVEGKELTAAQTEGVARLFASFTFSRLRPNDLQMLPAGLRARLLEHSLASPDQDKRERARKAFGRE